jgi:hypothetical protein
VCGLLVSTIFMDTRDSPSRLPTLRLHPLEDPAHLILGLPSSHAVSMPSSRRGLVGHSALQFARLKDSNVQTITLQRKMSQQLHAC